MFFGDIVFLKPFVYVFAMKVTSAAVHMLILLIGFHTASGFGNSA